MRLLALFVILGGCDYVLGLERNPPADAGPLVSGRRLLDGGLGHTCAIDRDDRLVCFGRNETSELGRNSTQPELGDLVPLEKAWAQVSAAVTTTCALELEGTLWCWGDNRYGQVGDGTTTEAAEPKQIVGLWAEVSAGMHHSRAIAELVQV